MLKKSIYLLALSSLFLALNGCSSTSEVHAYNNDFGILENSEANNQLAKEEFTTDEELQKYNDEVNSVKEFTPEKGTFLAKDWKPHKPVITYHYRGDPNFYRADELPEDKGRLGNVIIKVPSSMSKEEAFSELEGI